MRLVKSILAATAVAALVAVPAGAVTINEVVANDLSTDTHEFVELCGIANESLSGLYLVVIEGEKSTTGAGTGVIDVAIDLTGYVIPADGLFVIGDAAISPDLSRSANWIENGAETILLVSGFSSAIGTDIDVDNDCVADFGIGTIVDGIGLYGPGGTPGVDCIYYGVAQVGPDGTFDPAGAARCDDCDGPWGMICLNGTEPPPTGSACAMPAYIVEFASPGNLNCPPVPTVPRSWGKIKNFRN